MAVARLTPYAINAYLIGDGLHEPKKFFTPGPARNRESTREDYLT